MTKYEIDVLDKLRENPYFECLSVEALLYEAIRGTDIEEVQTVLDCMKSEIKVIPSSGCVYCDLNCCSPERHVE